MADNFITEIDILDEAKDNFLTYAEEVLTDRAIPTAEDGLLSVQRKILWTMHEILKMDTSSKTKKCASVVGTTLATAYFHGDSSCYGALCKMAQEYLMRYPLIDGQGSLGTQEMNGMQSSARYTECKPSKYADIMFSNFKKDVVPRVETYNNEYMEPVFLPSIFPNAIVNGRESIGVSMAHNSLPANLTEVCDGIIAYVKAHGDIDTKTLMEYIKGPDFPLGGTVINAKDIFAAYNTGRSTVSLKVRGDYIIEGRNIIFTSIPYRTYRSSIREDINKNVEELGKYIEDFTDESNLGQNRLVFTVKSDASIDQALHKLFELTDLQTTLSYNMTFIVNGTPRLCSLKQLIESYVKHQNNILIAAAQYDKNKAEKRAHIIKGLLKAIDKIDEVIALIRASSDKTTARTELIDFLDIDEEQANAILDMKLSRLTRIDKQELANELIEQENIIAESIKIINDNDYRDNKLISIVTDMRNKYGDTRRTKLENIVIPKDIEDVQPAIVENCVVIMTASGMIKRVPQDTFKIQKRAGSGIKTQDDITSIIIKTTTEDSILVFTNSGKMYKLPVLTIPSGTNTTKGTPVGALINLEQGEKVETIYSLYRQTDAKYVLFVTKNGTIKKTSLTEYLDVKSTKGVQAIKLREGDGIAKVVLVNAEDLLIVTANGKCLRFNCNEIGATGRSTIGLKGITLDAEDRIIAVLPIRDEKDSLAIFTTLGNGKRIPQNEIIIGKRAGKGMIIHKSSPSTGLVTAASLVSDNDNILISGTLKSICIKASDITQYLGFNVIGVSVIKGDINAVSKI